jgi:hypothetical protein
MAEMSAEDLLYGDSDNLSNCHIVLTLGKAGVLLKSQDIDYRQCSLHMLTPKVSSTHDTDAP